MVPVHADLNWADVTASVFSLFDWAGWGNAPQGLNSVSLWTSSLAVPALADRVRRDIESRDGKLLTLFVCAKISGPYAHPEDPDWSPRGARPSGRRGASDGLTATEPVVTLRRPTASPVRSS